MRIPRTPQQQRSGKSVTHAAGEHLPDNRAGVTLTEVLMTLMIMSIGVSSVMVLFPISVLRSVQSTQLTNAAILKYNTQSRLQQQPALIFDPDGNYSIQSSEENRQKALMQHYRVGGGRNYIVDPVGFHGLFGVDNNGDGGVTTDDDAIARVFGNDGNLPGFLNSTGDRLLLPRFDGGLLTRLTGLDQAGIDSSGLNDNQLSALQYLSRDLGNLGDGRTIQLDSFALNLLTYSSGGQTVVIGVQLTEDVLPDDLVAIPTGATTRPAGIPDPETSEITMFSVDGNLSQTFPITVIDAANRKIYWSEYDENGNSQDFNDNGVLDVRPLPLEFGVSPVVGRVILQSDRPSDYSWMLTVRRSSDGMVRGADVVVRFQTGTNALDERIFPASFTDGLAVIGVNNALDASGAPIEPTLKRGGFVFDPVNARWYRITDYEVRPALSGLWSANGFEAAFWSAYQYRVTLETEIVRGAGAIPQSTGAGWSAPVYSGAIFLPGVVDVYPLGSMPLPESL